MPDVLTLGGADDCKTYNDASFAKVRSYFGISDNFARESFDFNTLKPSGGKGGDPLVLTSDSLYFIKQINSNDQKILVDKSFSFELCEHVIDTQKPSILAPILAHFSKGGLNYIAMINALHFQGTYKKQYDLKGCADDKLLLDDGKKVEPVHKRIWRLDIRLGITTEKRRKYKKGKLEALHHPLLPLTKVNKDILLEAIKHDTAFLQKWKLMDYSLIVGVVDKSTIENEDNLKSKFTTSAELYAGKDLHTVSFVGIIDFLQRWDVKKKIAKKIKMFERNKATVPPTKYAERFVKHFEFVLIAHDEDVEEQHGRRDAVNKPHRCFPCALR
eukprot:maker-scaffold_20-snap-gene-5.0-mRNA-1 protein AED:0.07 eAED:0.07 QI:0/0/0.5/1/1/1/2/34/328